MTDDTALVTVGDLFAEPPEATPFVVDDLLPAGGVSLLVGGPKAGKSTLTESLALAMAQQGTWLGRGCLGGGVIMFAFESKRNELRDSLRRLGMQSDDSVLVKTGLPSVPVDWQPWEWLERTVCGPDSRRITSPPVLVVVDTLARLVRIRDGNDYHEVTDALAGIVEVARTTGLHVMLVHHARKGGNGGVEFGEEVLGSTALLGSVDTAISIRRDHESGARMVYSVNRYGVDLPMSYLVRDAETGAVTLGGSKAEAAAKEMEDEILDFVAAQPEPLTMTEIVDSDHVTGNAKRIRATVRKLSGSGRLAVVQGARRDSPRYLVPNVTGNARGTQ